MKRVMILFIVFTLIAIPRLMAEDSDTPATEGYYSDEGDPKIGPDGRPIQPGPEAMNPRVRGAEGPGPEDWRDRHPEMTTETGDIVMDYRSLVQKIDDLRLQEEDSLRRLDDLARRYEDAANKLEDLEKKWSDTADGFKKWAEEAQEKMQKINASWSEPTEVRGQVHGAPSDRYTTN